MKRNIAHQLRTNITRGTENADADIVCSLSHMVAPSGEHDDRAWNQQIRAVQVPPGPITVLPSSALNALATAVASQSR